MAGRQSRPPIARLGERPAMAAPERGHRPADSGDQSSGLTLRHDRARAAQVRRGPRPPSRSARLGRAPARPLPATRQPTDGWPALTAGHDEKKGGAKPPNPLWEAGRFPNASRAPFSPRLGDGGRGGYTWGQACGRGGTGRRNGLKPRIECAGGNPGRRTAQIRGTLSHGDPEPSPSPGKV